MTRRHLGVLVVLLLPLLLLGDALLPGRVLADAGVEHKHPWAMTATPEEQALPQVNDDTFRENLVYRVVLHDTLGQGRIPWWTPHTYGGSPFLALSHVEVLYPPNWVASRLSPWFAYGALIVFHLVIAGLGMWLFLNAAGLSGGVAVLGAVAFMLNGMFATRHGHPQYVATGCWLPWVLLGVQWLTSERRAAGALLVATTTALTVLAGHPSIYVYGYYLVGAWLLVRLYDAEALDWRGRGLAVGLFVAAFAVGVGLASTQLLATWELSQFSDRTVRSAGSLSRRLSHWSHLLRMVFPHITGTRLDGSYWSLSLTHQWAGTLYIGVAPLILAAYGAVKGGVRGKVLGGIALVSLSIMFVPDVYRLAWQWLPGFRFSRADRLSIVYFTAVSLLAAFGARSLLDSPPQADRRQLAREAVSWLVLLGALVACAAATIPELAGARHRIEAVAPRLHLWDQVARGTAFWLLTVAWVVAARAGWKRRWLPALIVLIAGADLAAHARHFVVTRDADRVLRETPLITWLRSQPGPTRIAKLGGWRGFGDNAIFPANTPMAFGIDDLHGFGPLHLDTWDTVLEAIDPERSQNAWHVGPLASPASLESPMLDALSVRYVLADRRLTTTSLDLVHAADGLFVYHNADAMPRAWTVEHLRVDRRDERAARQLAWGEVDPRHVAVLAEPLDVATGPDAQVAWVERSDDAIVLRKTGADPTVVVLSEGWYPGWTAFVDGEPVPVVRADVVLQAAPVPAGDHDVVFAYVPTYLPLAVRITGASAIGLLVLLAYFLGRRRRQSGSSSASSSASQSSARADQASMRGSSSGAHATAPRNASTARAQSACSL